MGRQAAPKIIPLTRKVQPLTRKVGVKFYGFIFWLKRIILGKFGIKNVLPIMTNHDRIAALLHDVFWKPHRQRGSLKPKYKAKTSRFLSTLRFLFGAPWETWTPMKLLSHGPEPCASANSAKGAYIKFLVVSIYTSRFLFTPLKRFHGLEPPWNCFHMDLNHARLPIPPYPQILTAYVF